MDEMLGVDQLVDALIEREGGFVDHPSDKGGATSFGITEAVARAHGYRGAMRDLPREEAAAIYKRLYWLRPRFDDVGKRSLGVAAEQRVINERSHDALEHRLATARTVAERLRSQARTAAADPGRGGAAPVPGLPAPAGKFAEAPGQDRLSLADRLTATEQAIQLDELIKWVRRQSKVDPKVDPRSR